MKNLMAWLRRLFSTKTDTTNPVVKMEANQRLAMVRREIEAMQTLRRPR